ncbi:MAG TPA: DUF488 domain-containing protein, partial [Geminicoccaceae bacterium]|nr:DUF488 domain-containing protein [Geminicoccaceae bacterium]
RHGIAALADVRSRPYSRFVPHFSKERLQRLLEEEGVGYLYLGRELGGKPPRSEVPLSAPGYASRVDQPEFRAGIERLLEAAAQRRTAMMCRERDPLDCHRLHLICRYVKPRAGRIEHILPNGEVEPQAATERRLLERAGAAELPLFGDSDALAHAYDRWWQKAR